MAKNVLIVDDDATMVNLLSTILDLEGFKTQKALSGQEALDLIGEELPDMVLLDIMMPGIDGFEVLARLRNEPRTEKLPVILLTAKTEDRDMFEGWKKGADEYVTKPFDPLELVKIINSVIERSYEERLEERARNVDFLLDLMLKIDEQKSQG